MDALCADAVSAQTDGKQPKLIISDYMLDTECFMSGDIASLTVFIYNTNSSRSVRNIKLSISNITNEIIPVDTSSIIRSYIGSDEVFEWSVEMEYEDRHG